MSECREMNECTNTHIHKQNEHERAQKWSERESQTAHQTHPKSFYDFYFCINCKNLFLSFPFARVVCFCFFVFLALCCTSNERVSSCVSSSLFDTHSMNKQWLYDNNNNKNTSYHNKGSEFKQTTNNLLWWPHSDDIWHVQVFKYH